MVDWSQEKKIEGRATDKDVTRRVSPRKCVSQGGAGGGGALAIVDGGVRSRLLTGGGGALAIVDGGTARDCWRGGGGGGGGALAIVDGGGGGFITTMRPGASWSANQLVNTPPKRPSSRGGAIAVRGKCA